MTLRFCRRIGLLSTNLPIRRKSTMRYLQMTFKWYWLQWCIWMIKLPKIPYKLYMHGIMQRLVFYSLGEIHRARYRSAVRSFFDGVAEQYLRLYRDRDSVTRLLHGLDLVNFNIILSWEWKLFAKQDMDVFCLHDTNAIPDKSYDVLINGNKDFVFLFCIRIPIGMLIHRFVAMGNSDLIPADETTQY